MADKKISQLTGASTPLAGTEVLPIVQSGSTVKVASNDLTVRNVRANATTGILQVTGPAAASTRVMTVPDANFTAARTDAAQTFTGLQSFGSVSVNGTGSGVAVVKSSTSDYPLRLEGAGTANASFIGVKTDDLTFFVNGADRASVTAAGNLSVANGNLVVGTAAKGIDFSANTHAAGMTSELLNWYEEGTFTPTVVGSTTAGTATYGGANGRYTRIGRTVQFEIYLDWTSGTGTGNLRFGALPFTANASLPYASAVIGYIHNFNWTAGTYPMALVIGTEVNFFLQALGGGSIANMAYSANGTAYVSGSYSV